MFLEESLVIVHFYTWVGHICIDHLASNPLAQLPTFIRRLQRCHNSAIKLMLELIQIKIHLSLVGKKHTIHAPLRGIKVVDTRLLLHPIQIVLQRTVIVLEDGGEGLFAEGLVDGEFDEEDAEVEDEALGCCCCCCCLAEGGG